MWHSVRLLWNTGEGPGLCSRVRALAGVSLLGDVISEGCRHANTCWNSVSVSMASVSWVSALSVWAAAAPALRTAVSDTKKRGGGGAQPHQG
jgi:hypothetical protein